MITNQVATALEEIALGFHHLAIAVGADPPTHATTPPPPVDRPAPRVCPVHNETLRFDEWTAKSGKACKAWRCPQSTPDTGCAIEWAS